MSFANLPDAIETFLQAARTRDASTLLAAFADDAVLVDGDLEHRGDAIREWKDHFLRKNGLTVHPINVTRRPRKTCVTVMVCDDDDRTGGRTAAQIDWTFTVLGGKISALVVVPGQPPALLAPVASYVLATNTFDLEALVGTFADDAVVNDQLREYWGRTAIRDWAARDIVSNHVTMYVVRAVEHHGHAIVTANVDGDYDKRGLPDPLVISFYFSIHRDEIIQLIILRNEPDV